MLCSRLADLSYCSVFGDLLGTWYIGKSVKDLEREVAGPTEEKYCCGNFVCCGNANGYCTALSCAVRMYGVKVKLCRKHMPSAPRMKAENVQELGTAVVKVDADGCWRNAVPNQQGGKQDPWILCNSRLRDWGIAGIYRKTAAAQHHHKVVSRKNPQFSGS